MDQQSITTIASSSTVYRQKDDIEQEHAKTSFDTLHTFATDHDLLFTNTTRT